MSRYRLPQPYSAPPFALVHRPADPTVVTLPVPGYRQSRNYSCGYAIVLMILRYWGRSYRGRELFHALGTTNTGTAQCAIVRVLRAEGVRANIRYDVTFDRIASCIDLSKILIGYLQDEDHWLIIYGYGRDPQRVFVADPEPAKSCEHAWADYGHRLGQFGIVCSVEESVKGNVEDRERF